MIRQSHFAETGLISFSVLFGFVTLLTSTMNDKHQSGIWRVIKEKRGDHSRRPQRMSHFESRKVFQQ